VLLCHCNRLHHHRLPSVPASSPRPSGWELFTAKPADDTNAMKRPATPSGKRSTPKRGADSPATGGNVSLQVSPHTAASKRDSSSSGRTTPSTTDSLLKTVAKKTVRPYATEGDESIIVCVRCAQRLRSRSCSASFGHQSSPIPSRTCAGLYRRCLGARYGQSPGAGKRPAPDGAETRQRYLCRRVCFRFRPPRRSQSVNERSL
jgi:hypothetical protein